MSGNSTSSKVSKRNISGNSLIAAKMPKKCARIEKYFMQGIYLITYCTVTVGLLVLVTNTS